MTSNKDTPVMNA